MPPKSPCVIKFDTFLLLVVDKLIPKNALILLQLPKTKMHNKLQPWKIPKENTTGDQGKIVFIDKEVSPLFRG